MIDWEQTFAAVWRQSSSTLRAVRDIDPVTLASLVGIERQKAALQGNTERFLAGQPANNALLSSVLVKPHRHKAVCS